MLGGNTSTNTKSSKRSSDSNSVSESFSKVRKQVQNGHDTDEEDGSTSLYPQTMEISSSADFQESSMEISQSDDIDSSRINRAHLPSLAENILKVKVDCNKKVGKKSENLPNTGISDVLDAEFALRNTSGGVIKLQLKTSLSPETRMKKIDEWQLNLNREREKRLTRMGQKEALDDIVDYRIEDLMIFVKKSSIILTEQSNLYVRRGTERYSPQTFFEIQNVFQKNDMPSCCCTNGEPVKSFTLNDVMPFGESTTVEYKQLKNFLDKLRQNLKNYIVQFANTAGGDVYFGITDDAIIKGQHVDDIEAVKHKIKLCMESKTWINKCGKNDDPVHGTRYGVDFFQVNGADACTFVIRVHICKYDGIVFHNDSEPEAKIVDDNNQIVKMSFERWLSSFINTVGTDKGNSNYRDRFKKRTCGTSTYYSVKDTVEKFVSDLASGTGQLKLHPSHAMKWIRHPALDLFMQNTKQTFKGNHWHSGIAYIEKSWEVNLGLPSTKPDNVICDILLCCQKMPLVFVSLTSETPDENSESCSYNRKVAAILKTKLVQDTGCLEKFYVKPIVVSHQQLENGDVSRSLYSESPLYPETYRMSNEKYSNILENLVLILARANTMSSHIVGHGLFNLLTYEQYKILHDDFDDCPMVKITGPPGSGKTILALERIRRLRNEGCSCDEVLFLCSNKPLKARVENMETPDGQQLCIVKIYQEIESLAQSDVDFNHVLGQVKHILSDETQNYQINRGLDWWSKLKSLCEGREDSSFWVFYDIAQKITNKSLVNLGRFAKRELKTVIRQTGNVHRFITSKFMRVDPRIELGHDFDGQEVDVLLPSGTNAAIDPRMHLTYILISQLHKLIVRDGHHVNEITVLFNDKKAKEYYEDLFVQHTNNSCPVRNGEEVNKYGVVFDTIRRYSGVDDNIIIGFCPKFYPSGFQNNRALMTALCSRTKLKLILVLEGEEDAECFKLASTDLKKIKFGNMRSVSNFSRQCGQL